MNADTKRRIMLFLLVGACGFGCAVIQIARVLMNGGG